MPSKIEMDLPDRFWKSRAEDAEAEVERLRALLRDLARARPLLLYGEPWVDQIRRVLDGEPYKSVFPDRSEP